MKRAIAFSSVLFLLACGDVPTEVPVDMQPEFATVIGDGATWYFEGAIHSAADPSLIGQTVQGSIAFTIWTDDVLPEIPCIVHRYVESVATYTVDGQEFTLSDANGQALTYMSCAYGRSWISVNAREGELIAQFSLSYPADNEDFPLTPPPVGGEMQSMTVWNPLTGESGFQAELSKVYTGPQTKDDCKNRGWEQYTFQNQGQCVRYIETGKDSR